MGSISSSKQWIETKMPGSCVKYYYIVDASLPIMKIMKRNESIKFSLRNVSQFPFTHNCWLFLLTISRKAND